MNTNDDVSRHLLADDAMLGEQLAASLREVDQAVDALVAGGAMIRWRADVAERVRLMVEAQQASKQDNETASVRSSQVSPHGEAREAVAGQSASHAEATTRSRASSSRASLADDIMPAARVRQQTTAQPNSGHPAPAYADGAGPVRYARPVETTGRNRRRPVIPTPRGGRPPTQSGPVERGAGAVNAQIAVIVPTQCTTGPPSESEPSKYPARPDPGDAAAEVWALVERAQAGESEAFGLIYDRYVDTVFRFVYFRVGNRQLAEDLTSDTFLRALKRIGSFTWQGRDLGAWLVTIARNLVADHFRSGRYRLEVTTGDVLDADREDRGPEGSQESAVVDHITNVALLTAVKQLNPEQQECIVLRFLQGFSVAETAQTMGKNEGAIKALQYRAVRALARLMPEGFQW